MSATKVMEHAGVLTAATAGAAALIVLLSFSLETLIAVAAVAGLAAVVTEILVKDPSVLSELTTDVRKMAEPDRRTRTARTASGRANDDDFRHAA